MVTFPDYESAGENPFAIREATRFMESEELLEWVKRRIIRIGGVAARPLIEEIVLPPIERPVSPTRGRIRSGVKLKKLKCGHLVPRRKGVYPRRCEACIKTFHERVLIMKRKML